MCKIEMVEGFTFDYISRSRILKEKKKMCFCVLGFFFTLPSARSSVLSFSLPPPIILQLTPLTQLRVRDLRWKNDGKLKKCVFVVRDRE